MKAFLVGLIFLIALGIFGLIGILLMPIYMILGWFLGFVLILALGIAAIWFLGKIVILFWEWLRAH